jgi:sialate O-acetylesterase
MASMRIMRIAKSALCVPMLIAAFALHASAETRLPNVFSDNMVLQRGMPVAVWGWDTPGREVAVSFAGRTKPATAGPDGKWSLRLDAMEASAEPRTMAVRGSTEFAVKNVLVGEVWLCSGQSNMGWSIRKRVKDAAREKAEADWPLIRITTSALTHSLQPLDDMPLRWMPIRPGYDGAAVPYFFGREIHRELGVPVGLLHSSWGGASVESFTRREVIERHPDFDGKYLPLMKRYQEGIDNRADEKNRPLWLAYKKKQDAWNRLPPDEKKRTKPPSRPKFFPSLHPRSCPTALYNGMIHPLLPFTIRGAVWYQGEANAGTGLGYERLLRDMIVDWRAQWTLGDFRFIFAQLPGLGKVQTEPAETRGWMHIREAMRRTLAVPNTGMAVLIDIGETKDIHCWNKAPAGRRLALWALARDYGRDVVHSGPLYRSHEKRGGRFVVKFDSVGSGLTAAAMRLEGTEWVVDVKAPGSEEIRGFAVTGDAPSVHRRKFVWANARIVARDTLEVWSDEVADPVAVRYGWAGFPVGNLYNVEKLPASPFTTEE